VPSSFGLTFEEYVVLVKKPKEIVFINMLSSLRQCGKSKEQIRSKFYSGWPRPDQVYEMGISLVRI